MVCSLSRLRRVPTSRVADGSHDSGVSEDDWVVGRPELALIADGQKMVGRSSATILMMTVVGVNRPSSGQKSSWWWIMAASISKAVTLALKFWRMVKLPTSKLIGVGN